MKKLRTTKSIRTKVNDYIAGQVTARVGFRTLDVFGASTRLGLDPQQVADAIMDSLERGDLEAFTETWQENCWIIPSGCNVPGEGSVGPLLTGDVFDLLPHPTTLERL